MREIAFLFPGQGSQYVGMGEDLYDAFPEAHEVFDRADDVLGSPLSAVMFGTEAAGEEAEQALQQTDVTQPALFVHSMAVTAVVRAQGLQPDMVAGHSLGEYSALAAAKAISFEQGLRIVRLRGELMAAAGDERPGTMAAVLGLDDGDVVSLCEEASEAPDSIVEPANFNAPGQVVISGDPAAVERAEEIAKRRGARRVVRLPVSGAFHSPLMTYARDGLADALGALDVQPPTVPVYLNVTAEPTRDPDEIRKRLLDQLMAPVRWSQTLRRMQSDGADRFVEVGAGRVLTGLVRRTLGRDVDASSAGTLKEIQALQSQAV